MRRAFSLVEMVVAVALMGLVGSVLVSLMTLSTRAIPGREDASTITLDVERALGLVSAELAEAIGIVSMSEKVVEFRVPDRDSDGVDEVVRYEWSGVKGEAIKRGVNGATPVAWLSGVEGFKLTASTAEAQATLAPVLSTTGEYLIASYTGAGTNDYTITSANWQGQYVLPTLPAGAVSWSVSRVRVVMKLSGGSGSTVTVELRPSNANKTPQSTVLASTVVNKSALSSTNTWLTAPVGIHGLSPGVGVCFVVRTSESNSTATLRWQNGSVSQDPHTMVRSTDGGSAWSVMTLSACLYEVYGTHTIATPVSEKRTHALSVKAEIERGGVTLRRVIALANRPVVED